MVKGIWLMTMSVCFAQVLMFIGLGSATSVETVRIAVIISTPITAVIATMIFRGQ